MRRFLLCLVVFGLGGAFSGCFHHRSPVTKFLKKRHAVHTGQHSGN